MKHDLIIHYTPNEITQIVEKSVCPVCKERLDANIETSKIDDLICSYTSCLSINDHYNIMWEYKDPKHILLITQVIDIIEENMCYNISLYKDKDNNEHTDIQMKDTDSDEFINRYFTKERIFDFKKFNRKQWVKELKTMALLG